MFYYHTAQTGRFFKDALTHSFKSNSESVLASRQSSTYLDLSLFFGLIKECMALILKLLNVLMHFKNGVLFSQYECMSSVRSV